MNQQYDQFPSSKDWRYLNDCWLLKPLFQLEREALSEQCLEHHLASIGSHDRGFSGLRKLNNTGGIYATNQTISPSTP
jgi:hypothetical protein